MTSKEERMTDQWLKRAMYAHMELKAIEVELNEKRAQYTSITPNLSGMPHGSANNHKFDSFVIAIEDLQNKKAELTKQENEVREVIDKIDDPVLRILLRERYMNGNEWDVVSMHMHYEPEGGYVYVLRRKALAKVYSELQLMGVL